CTGNGINLANLTTNSSRACTVRHCRMEANTNYGLVISGNLSGPLREHVVEGCQALNNGLVGFSVGGFGSLLIRNLASGNGTADYSLLAGNRFGAIITPATNSASATDSGGG